jgi:hypothetical protein
MSISKMISLHPDVGGDLNEPLATAIRHAMFCAVIATSCADACAAEPGDMSQCIRVCSDTASICTATAAVATRRTGQNVAVMRAMLETCILACETSAAECESHDHEHCQWCAKMCRECAADCRTALPTVN